LLHFHFTVAVILIVAAIIIVAVVIIVVVIIVVTVVGEVALSDEPVLPKAGQAIRGQPDVCLA
jgi:hypothetical protein